MSDYVQKRINYINDWPNCTPFEAEENYKHRCDQFLEINHRYPLTLMKLWIDADDNYNRAISHVIDSLDVMPYHPNFAFSFAFSSLDYYCKRVYSKKNITCCLKKLADDISDLSSQDSDVHDLLKPLFLAIPVSGTMYLYKNLCGLKTDNNAYTRVTTNIDNRKNCARSQLIDSINQKYGQDTTNRNPALLYRRIFSEDQLSIDNVIFKITNNTRLHLLLSGIIYTLRNDSLHGSSMSSTKSSKTTPKRYALNYYGYLATYTILMIFFIKCSSMSDIEKRTKYSELKDVTIKNMSDFREFFGNHIQ